MERVMASVRIDNITDRSKTIRCDALVDTGASHMILPSAWKDRLGELELIETVELETAAQKTVTGEIWGPVKIQVEGFRHTYTEVIFVEMTPEDGVYEPLIGYIVLEQAQIAVDMVRRKLMPAKRLDLKHVGVRQCWEEQSKLMAARGDDKLLDEGIATSWDEEEWQW
jgi:predicted aspartyl protease